MNKYLLFLFAALLAIPLSAKADADADWHQIEILDKGPQQKPATQKETLLMAHQFLTTQLQAVQSFSKKYPSDNRIFDARMREAALLAALGQMGNDHKLSDRALQIYAALEAQPNLSPAKQADAGFARVVLYIQTVDRATSQGRQLTLNAIDNFKAHYPNDRRAPRLLVEGATICDDNPEKKREMLLAAKSLSKEEDLNLRINDDLHRLDMLDKPLSLTASSIQGGEINLESLRGKTVAIVFWAADSIPCQLWIRNFRSAVSKFPNSLVVITISLDTNRLKLESTMKEIGISSWPTNFDGKGWENPIARRFGINALPTLWLVDRQGKLRTLNARDNYEHSLRQLVQENK